ncbi:MAG: hypothetical protein L6R40_006175 [Gallowayella cf. fulva]|nr:MAG: hypothetical protein L6R40_006175 [Xanthomendoza cf. fulva]
MSLEGLSEAHGAEVPLSHSLWETLTEGVKKNAEGQAIVSLWQPADHLSSWISRDTALTAKSCIESDHLSWTYTELQFAAEQLASALYSKGVRKGSRIAVFLYNSVEWGLFLWACARLTACFCPLNPRATHRPQELQHLLDTLHADVIVVQDSHLLTELEKNASHIVSSTALKIACDSVPTEHRERWSALSTLEASQRLPHPDGLASSGNDPAVIVFTSGSTGVPKACVRTAGSLSHSHYRNSRETEKGHRFLFNTRTFHIALFANLTPWRAGAASIIASREFDAKLTLQALSSHSISHMQATPSMIYALLGHPLFSTHPPQGLVFLELIAEIIPSELVYKCNEQLKAQRVTSTWGMTEIIGATFCGPEGSIPSQDGTLSVGKVSPGGLVRICGPGTRLPLKEGS